ncbi:Secreted protein [Pseudomonas brassicacearum]
MGFNLRFYATVNCTTSFSGVVSNWAGFAVANRLNAGRFNTVLVGQNLLNGVCTTLRQFLVVSVRTDGVSVTFNSGAGGWVLLHEVSQVLDVAVAVRLDNRLVEVELHVQLNTYDFSNSWAAISVNGYVGWGVRALVDVVAHAIVVAVGADFSRSWNWSSSRLGAATEVHTDTDAWSPLGVALVDVVLSFNAGTGVEVLGEVQLGAAANVGEGGTVTAVAAILVDALVGETGRNVWTQHVAWVVEVVQSVQSGVGAFDVGAVVSTGVVHFVVGQTQFNVVGQEVTNRTAEQVAVVLEVTSAVELFFLGEAFDFNCALALCQSAERSGSNQRTNGKAQGVFQFHPLNPHLVIVKQSRKPGDNSAASLTELAYT